MSVQEKKAAIFFFFLFLIFVDLIYETFRSTLLPFQAHSKKLPMLTRVWFFFLFSGN